MTATRICDNCGKEFSYEPPVGYPDKRKYCDECSAIKKAEWAAKQGQTSPQPQKVQPEAPKQAKSYHLTDEAIRSNALDSAIHYIISQTLQITPEQAVKMAKIFEVYIRNG